MSPHRQLQGNKPLILVSAAIAAAGLAAFGTYIYNYSKRVRRCKSVLRPYEDIMLLTKDKMVALKNDFKRQVRNGLGDGDSTLMMLPSMVDILPGGHETGDFWALDLGGTNFRVLYIRLSDDHGQVDDVVLENFPIPEKYFSCPVEELFDLLGRTFAEFAGRMKRPHEEELHMGFCFSFPVEQTSIDKGKIVVMTKKFTNPGSQGADPVALLEAACQKAGQKVQIRALLNDTVGTLASGRYSDPEVTMGIILGTGTNCCYIEQVSNIKKLKDSSKGRPQDSMVINMEWGSYISDLLPMTADDHASDSTGANPGKCFFEKLISGMFMGEAVRRILLNLAENADLFGGEVPAKLRKPWHLTTPDIAAMDEDNSLTLSTVGSRLATVFGLSAAQCPFSTRQQVKYVCWLVANRSARLLAMAVAGLLEHTNRADPVLPTVISVDGGVFEHYLAYRRYLRTALGWMIGHENVDKIKFNQFRESSSRGAAYLAAAVRHQDGIAVC